MSPPTTILFVCTGNICRSPMAEGVLRKKARDAGIEVITDSAGTTPEHVGEPPDPMARKQAAARGYELPDHKGRQVRVSDFIEFDLVLAMTRNHLRALERYKPDQSPAKLKLFMDFAPQQGVTDVPDPWALGPEAFDRALDMIEAGVDGLIKHLKQRG